MEPGRQDAVAEERSGKGALLFYGALLLLVALTATVAVWALVERRRLDAVITPLPLPEITIVTTRPDADATAAWVALLQGASFSTTVVTPGDLTAEGSVLVLLDLEGAGETDLRYLRGVVEATAEGTIVTGGIGQHAEAMLGIATEEAEGSNAFTPTPPASPVMARVGIEHQFGHAPRRVHTLRENASMSVDARWEGTSRAAIAHWTREGERFVWFGFQPRHLANPEDAELGILLRAAARWADGQPVSDGAIAGSSRTPSLNPAERQAARGSGLAYSVDATSWPGIYSVRVLNRTKETIDTPAVAIWVPEGTASEPELWGSPILNRYAEVTTLNDHYVVVLHSLSGGEERLLALEIE